ncbi:hypothetical protein PBI_JOHANN_46 [Microbacterium phage Johann]|uniref:Uncharacterized protein n=2 Tax=Goodmanvirus goodman TaxID=2734238 RepID=A0A3G3LZX9_9CAUD|nr:hypothetical protein HOU56_gp46 [Microbacterium phage Goodman]AYQ99502.1 hypothetical protein PBI_GOODMAN_46 [Microbacterium phage Goodman]AYQ99670.1 hypothetical protein PBI_JOHANN_46 [Microbacterium phage Johann]
MTRAERNRGHICWCVRHELRPHPWTEGGCPAHPVTADWTDARRAPRGFGGHGSTYADRLAPEYIQANLFTLAQIGGLYDLICLQVEKDHLVMLTAWRLDSGAPRAIDYLKNAGARLLPNEEKRDPNAQGEQPPEYLTGTPGGHR